MLMKNKTLVILGSYGLAKEFYLYSRDATDFNDFIFVNDLDDGQNNLKIGNDEFRVVKNWHFDKKFPFIVAVGNPEIKKYLVEKAILSGLYPYKTIIHPSSYVKDVKVGKGGMISPNCILTANIKIGEYVTLNLSTTVGHDTVIGDYTTTNPGVHISGNVTVGKFNEFGTGCIVRDGISICDDNLFGAQTAIVKDIESKGTYIGVPSKLLKKNELKG